MLFPVGVARGSATSGYCAVIAEDFDVIIVGARCAGSPLATLLAGRGLRVCLVDKAGFPSDTPSTHIVQPSGVEMLEQLGVLEAVLKAAPPVERATIILDDDARIELDNVVEDFGAPAVSPRRVALDAILLDAAAAAGVEVRTQTPVSDLVEERGRIVGVETRTGILRAPLVVGADGARSTVARLVEAPEYRQTPPGRVFMWGYFEGVDSEHHRLWIGKVDDLGFLASPADSGLFMAAVAPSVDRRDELRGERETAYTTGLTRWPELHDSLAGARRVGPVQFMSRWHGFFRHSAGPGWVLVGDAGHFKDPTPGQGITDALRQSVELAAAIEKGLGGAGPADTVLRDWWAWRDRDAWEMYWFAHDLGAPGRTPPLLREIQRRIAADPELTHGLMQVMNHDRAPSEVFKPSIALRAIAKALRTNPGERRAVLSEARMAAGNQLRRRMPAELRNGRVPQLSASRA